jgi:TRAP-type C4-dicarboxylate transport system permease small subunit
MDDRMNDESKPTTLLEKIRNVSLILCVVVMFAPILLNIILRYGFNSGFVSSDEIGRVAFIYMTFIGGAITFIEGRHIGVEGVPAMVKPAVARVLKLAALALTLITTLILAGGAWQLILHNRGGRTPVLEIPIELLYLPVLFAGAIIVISIVIKAVAILRN